MSISTTPEVKQYRLAIFPSKSLDDMGFLDELFLEKIPTISHIYTNGASPLVAQFALDNGIPYTVYGLISRSLPWSTGNILDNSDYAIIIAGSDSKSSKQIEAACVKKKVKFKTVSFESTARVKAKLGKVQEILSVMTPEDREKSENWVKQLEKVTQ